MSKKIKQILFKMELEGDGIVNFDSNDQKWIFAQEKSSKTSHLVSHYKNVSYAKKNFYYDEDNNLIYKIKISSDCLRNAMFRDDLVAQSSVFQHSDALLYSYIATPIGIIRGYLFASLGETIKRKSPLTLKSAEQISLNQSALEVHSKSGEKDTHENKEGGDTTFFHKENVGKIKYSTSGNINLGDMQFVACDSIMDRYGFNPDKYESMYKVYAEKNVKKFNADLGYYTLSTSIVDIPEYGLKLSNETTLQLVKETLKRLLNIKISRATSYAQVQSLKIKLVENPLKDTMDDENNWINITEDTIDQLSFDIYDAYVKENDTSAKKLREDIEKLYTEEQERKKAEKAEKAAKAAKAKQEKKEKKERENKQKDKNENE